MIDMNQEYTSTNWMGVIDNGGYDEEVTEILNSYEVEEDC